MLCHIPLPCIISLSDGRLQKENTKRKLGEKNHGVKYVFGLKHSDLQLWVSLLQVVRKDRPTQLLFYLGQSMTTELFILKFQSYDKKGIKSYVMNWNEGGKYCRLFLTACFWLMAMRMSRGFWGSIYCGYPLRQTFCCTRLNQLAHKNHLLSAYS